MKYKALPNSGFIIEPHHPKDYIFGSSERSLGVQEILCLNGQWDEYKPIFESQRNLVYTDPWMCTNEALTNCLEFIHKKRYGEESNRSERFSALTSGTKPRVGNSIKAPSEACRTKGTVSDASMPYTPTMTESEFYNYADLTPNILAEGLKWLEEYDFGYEKLHLGSVMDKKKAMEALKYSPLQTAIDSSTRITANFRGWNDSVVIYGYELGKCWKVFGSYTSTCGEYEWNYPFYTPNKFHLKKKLTINLENNMLKIIRNKDNGRIYLQDSDLVIHWVETEADFKRLLGINAWNNKEWQDLSVDEIIKLVEGVTLSARKIDFIQTLKSLLNNLGFKKN